MRLKVNCSSLKYRIAVIFSLIFGGVLILALWLELRGIEESQRAQLDAKEKVYANFLGEVSRDAIIRGEYEVIQLHIKNLLSDPHIRFIAISDNRDRIVAATDPSRIGRRQASPAVGPDEHSYVLEITNPAGLVGKISFIFSHVSATREYQRQMYTFAGSAIFSLLVVICCSLVVGNLLTRRLKHVADAATRFGEGDWKVRIQDSGSDEIAQLAFNFNGMAERLDSVMVQLQHQASYDQLTGLPNRSLLYDRIDHAVSLSERNGNKFAIMLLDLDNFKSINDTLGHHLGDNLLIEVGKRISSVIRKSDTLARLGGDEYVILTTGISTPMDASKICRQVVNSFEDSFILDNGESFITTSIGVAIYPDDGDTPDLLLKNADIAMYHSKKTGKNTFQFFTEEIQSAVQMRLVLESRLRKALERGEFFLMYQPQINVTSGRIEGLEALIRWQPENKGVVSPDKFIPVLEDTGMIIHVGDWVLETACRQLSVFRNDGLSLRMAVNMSIKQFQSPDIVERISSIVLESGCKPDEICLELTESIIMERTHDMIEKLHRLRRRGFRLSIDDFGTGYSSLIYLKSMPISEVKIAREFITGLPEDGNDVAIVNTIISMARHMGMTVIAEGVEKKEQVESLVSLGCKRIQGYFYSKPIRGEEVAELIRKMQNARG